MDGLQLYIKHAQTPTHMKALSEELKNGDKQMAPIVFVSVFEHNSNMLPWKVAGARVHIMPMTQDGDMDYAYIENKFKEI